MKRELSQTVEIAIPGPFLHTFTYRIPPGIDPAGLFEGQRVLVPFRKALVVGFVHREGGVIASQAAVVALHQIEQILDSEAILPPILFKVAKWAAAYYLAPPGEVYRALFPAYALKKQMSSCILSSAAKGEEINQRPSLKVLTSPQQAIFAELLAQWRAGEKSPCLLHGVTGSGKTEIYLHLMAEALAGGGQALFLVPEIGLTPQLAARVEAVFKECVVVYHSALTDKARFGVWERVRSGEPLIVLGTRSAVWLPFARLGLLVVDEEHDGAYKQEAGFRYHGRDIAVLRGNREGALVVLGSATPSLETRWNAETGKYRAFSLRTRPRRAELPRIIAVDLRRYRDKKGGFPLLSDPLRIAIETHLARHHQVLLFLNRRGYAPLLFCNACGESVKCGSCSVSLTVHRSVGECHCHYCGFRMKTPAQCPGCGALALAALGAGTERLESTVSRLFPRARVRRADRDVFQAKSRREQFHRDVEDHQIDILLGTQVLGKGHDFSRLTLVGVINADFALNFPDFRAEERAFQTLLQVSGRAGRAEAAGEVFIQTANPDHPIFSALRAEHRVLLDDGHEEGEPNPFWRTELDQRKIFRYPPWANLAQLEVSGRVEKAVWAFAHTLAKHLKSAVPRGEGFDLLGPVAAPLRQLRGLYRVHLLCRGPKRTSLAPWIKAALTRWGSPWPRDCRLDIDVDPQSLL